MCLAIQTMQKESEEKGEIKGENKMILKMYNKGYSIADIANISEKSEEEINKIIADNQ